MLDRITFITLGQTPRSDIIPEVSNALSEHVDINELGALDGLSSDEIRKLYPKPDDKALVTRLRDGTQTVIGKRWLELRLQSLLDRMPAKSKQLSVLLCTGDFSSLSAPGLYIDAQHLVDHGVKALCYTAKSIGLVLPLRRQIDEHHCIVSPDQKLLHAVASPYLADDFTEAGRSLSDCDIIVMHCMGYTSSQRETVAASSGRPVLLSRKLVAAGLSQFL